MKTIILLSFLLAGLGYSSYGQSVERLAITSGAGFATSTTGETLQYTIGQSYFTQTLTDGNSTYLTQGFQQPTNFNYASLDAPSFRDIYSNKIEAFPNPAINYVDILLGLIDDDGAKVSLMDIWGQPIKKQDYAVTKGKQQLHFVFGNVPAALYTLRVEANKKVYSKKILVAGLSSKVSF
ncbi:T9SS type A sorting domain-containing protein [Pedobacter sp. SD-b]|uniref:T9SS type A sorting domain-containing protein n=1 Tax=Pedobacter segetis TaxID=2793069 RepID=A0ABS1BFZ0_9SPHI|nr:T9SS type A sorting domain-containing protein [Pedobacter segetis]MBK0381784.1 T9SS type A sorting domain-containing protein [Pedobacter segetis]